ncbi:uncharacterized protein LOC141641461 [Silene latifolia]|uniref:uncharacterized protein LOC141641461 n=1 Tax=Silene latifolia TaxID=37657 RepID=UPI003D76F42E
MTEAYCTPYSVYPGGDKLYKALKKTFWWPGMKKEVAEFVGRCLTSQRVKGEQRRPQGPQMVQDMIEHVNLIRQKMKAAQDRQKSYVDLHRMDIEFEVVDKVLLKVSPMRGVMRFGKRENLSQKFIGPYDILDPVENIELDEALTYAEVPKEILDRKLRKTKNRETVVLKVLWSNHNVEEATWEPEVAMRERYPHLFEQEPELGFGGIGVISLVMCGY